MYNPLFYELTLVSIIQTYRPWTPRRSMVSRAVLIIGTRADVGRGPVKVRLRGRRVSNYGTESPLDGMEIVLFNIQIHFLRPNML